MSERYEYWKSKIKPMNIQRIRLPFAVQIFEAEKACAAGGLLPESMDDKWVGFWFEQEIVFCRSWTGHQIYRLSVSQSGDHYNVGPLEVIDDSSIYQRSDDSTDLDIVARLLSRLIGKNAALQTEADSSIQPAK